MNAFRNTLRRFVKSEEAVSAAEYAVMLALVIVVCLAAIIFVGNGSNSTFTDVGSSIPAP